MRKLSELLTQDPIRIVQNKADVRIQFAGHTFAVVWRGASDVASIAAGLRRLTGADGVLLPLLAVPHMGAAGAAFCQEAGVGWLDLSGNARIIAPGLNILIEGKPNSFKRAGRPGTVFAPKSARIARWLLGHADESATQTEIASATEMDPGFTSRIIHRLLDDELVARSVDGRISVPRPGLLLDAWAEQYAFDKHEVHKGVVAARSGTELALRMGAALAAAQVQHAFTGLVAAWQYTHFAAYRLATVYLPAGVSPGLLTDLGFRAGERGANTWLVVPNDTGVLYGAAEVDGLRCVHPAQAWLDLRAQPERAKEAAERLRTERLRWIHA